MTWTELYKLFDAECKRAHDTIGSAIKEGKKFRTYGTEGMTKEDFAAVALTCKYFAENRSWPIVKWEVKWECFRRIQAARDFCKFVCCPSRPNVKFAESVAKESRNLYSDSELIEWILVDYYLHAGMWADLYQGSRE
ncbi:MAG TPA: hypothetical protein VIK53_17070 [Verrucomicrobiae bacterium]